MDEETRAVLGEMRKTLNHMGGVIAAQGCMVNALVRVLDMGAAVRLSVAFLDEAERHEANSNASAVTENFLEGFQKQKDRLSGTILLGRFPGVPGAPGR